MSTPEASPGPAPAPNASPASIRITPLPKFTPELYERVWVSVPHPTLPLLATAHGKSATIFSLRTLAKHSALTDGHNRSVRTVAWMPGLPPHRLCLATGSFDATTGLWRWNAEPEFDSGEGDDAMAVDVTQSSLSRRKKGRMMGGVESDSEAHEEGTDWEFTVVLEGQENEIKGVAFSPSGQYLATCSRDKTIWIWEDVREGDGEDDWETVTVLNEHDGDVKAVAWCPDVPGRDHALRRRRAAGAVYSPDVLASASYDNTVRIWREVDEGEWVCVAVLEGHEGTVWGLQWEPAPPHNRFPRLLTFSADATIRIWSLRQEDDNEEEDGANGSDSWGEHGFRGGLGGIPNTMRRGVTEDWDCTAVLPKIHTRDIYSAAWSAASGLVASTGGDGIIAVYREEDTDEAVSPARQEGDQTGREAAAAEQAQQQEQPNPQSNGTHLTSGRWRVVGQVSAGHGEYEINHVTWSKRFDLMTERKGVEEMLITSGDDGVVRPWQVAW
ncbi:hypothetical protein VTK73DRAFT_132 [Phialemonium thermophilum]|uniref:Probable cytosolic iron-sulfur protein assembly protein 1 n=1 Tax=Phialemonium thermophilum TaxID=223376 RepID=A0ABR3Y5B2_9PEZI